MRAGLRVVIEPAVRAHRVGPDAFRQLGRVDAILSRALLPVEFRAFCRRHLNVRELVQPWAGLFRIVAGRRQFADGELDGLPQIAITHRRRNLDGVGGAARGERTAFAPAVAVR